MLHAIDAHAEWAPATLTDSEQFALLKLVFGEPAPASTAGGDN